MDGSKSCPFRKGDIVRNLYAGEGNPCRYLMYFGKGTVRQGRYTHKTYDCIDYSGEKAHFIRDDAHFEVVGHMEEFDSFIAALKNLKTMGQNG